MGTAPNDYETLSEELDQAETAFDFAQWRYHLAEAKELELKIAQRQSRPDAVNVHHKSSTANEPASGRAKPETKNAGRESPRRSSRRRFIMEGPTTVIVRLLYDNRAGMTSFEMQARNGIAIKGRTIRKIINRLLAAGYAVRNGKKVLLTDTGITAWEDSPLFLRASRNNQGRAA